LLFQFEEELFLKEVKEVLSLNWQTPGLINIVELLAKELKNFDLEKFSKKLAEDLKEKLMELLLNPEFEKNIKNVELEKEWQKALYQVKKNIVHAEIEEINQEIKELDKKNQRTDTEELRLDKLLGRIVKKQAQLKN